MDKKRDLKFCCITKEKEQLNLTRSGKTPWERAFWPVSLRERMHFPGEETQGRACCAERKRTVGVEKCDHISVATKQSRRKHTLRAGAAQWRMASCPFLPVPGQVVPLSSHFSKNPQEVCKQLHGLISPVFSEEWRKSWRQGETIHLPGLF